ncbi:unnamed protein product (macronuclear) [Paramecium tetraurelia]|uniref:Granulins domain-containing protein n=1 Tax=Paramecium tetraurelia TaxID=5888 RepID=A0D5P6_PARTE|nr:uncharacterized protein GSPATT00013793001 [Paramecium tetraurelia]CAK78363.1 unnamed protein product [Paramecium tetraurelia]|eukprot:XP_001445760.1 hypothetical protein (macronuclear) [Paramecium tetraurelia strain d4-2]
MLLLFIFIVPLLGQTCFSNKAAVDCGTLKCCTQEGYCAVQETDCYYSAEKCTDQQDFHQTHAIMLNVIIVVFTMEILLSVEPKINASLGYSYCWVLGSYQHQLNIATRMIVIAEKAKLVALDNSRKSIVSQIIGTEEQYGKEFQVNKDNYNLQL